jgi:hypothetical protein
LVVTDSAGKKLAYIYFEEEPERRVGGKIAHQRRGSADCGEYRDAAGTIAEAVIRSVELIVQRNALRMKV